MQVSLYVEINAIALIILFLIYCNIRRTIDKHLIEQKLFLRLMTFTSLILIFDTFMWVLDGKTFYLSNWFLLISTTVYFILHPVICMYWAVYVDFQINRDAIRIKKLLIPMSVPIIINLIFSILSLFTNFYYYFDSRNVYHRGQYFWLVPVVSFIYVIYYVGYVLKNRRKINQRFYVAFLMFAIPPVIGSIIQIAFYGIATIWVGMSISILIIYINIQNEQVYMDYLTGLFNRRQLDFYLNEVLQKENVSLAGIMLDLNSFKHINDHYGHYTGDEALKYTSQILKKTFDNKAFLSRFGGDEFVILFEVQDRIELESAINRLKENVQKFNASKELPYEIEFSIGADLYPMDTKMNGQEFLCYIDSLMYHDKKTLFKKKNISTIYS